MIWPFLYLSLGMFALALSCFLVSKCLRLHCCGLVICLISVGVLASASIVLSGTCLGYWGQLSDVNLLLWQFVQLGICVVVSARRGIAIVPCFQSLRQELSIRWKVASHGSRYLLLSLVLVVIGVFVVALFSNPGDFDSHGYRLSRIALWLQDGAIFHSTTSDLRMNYSAFNGDLLMLWFTAPFAHGYPLVTIVQSLAGVFTLLSVWSLSRLCGYSKMPSLLAVCLMLSMATFVAQMTTEQVDLLVGAYTVAAVALLYAGLRRGLHPLPGALALALAVGTKGSMFYYMPGMAFVGLFAIYSERANLRTVLQFTLFVVGTLAVWGAPRYVENALAYGNPFAPKADLERLHDNSSLGGFSVEKLRLNSICYAIQVFGPVSNPFGTFEVFRPVGDALSVNLPEEKDIHSVSRSRKKWFDLYQSERFPHEYSLTGSTGALSFVLCLIGGVLALYRCIRYRDKHAACVLALLASCAIYHFTMAGMFKWSPFKFRYYLNVMPFVAIAAAYTFQFMKSGVLARNLSLLTGFMSVAAGFHFLTTGVTSGFGSLKASSSLTNTIVQMQGGALRSVMEQGGSVAVALPYYARLSGFFRNGTQTTITLLNPSVLGQYNSAEDFLLKNGYDAVVTANMYWKDIGTHVTGIAWGMAGKISSRDSIEIIRRCGPEEVPMPYVNSVIRRSGAQQEQACYTYELRGVAENADLIFVSSDSSVSFEDPRLNFTVEEESLAVRRRVPINTQRSFSFCVERGKEATAQAIFAKNFRPLYRDPFHMLPYVSN